jgi:predicted Rdx family selenoprotein
VEPRAAKALAAFLEEAKTKIVSYYATQCDFIINKAESLKGQEAYNEALYNLALVPDICKDCYFKCLNEMSIVYDLKINSEGKKLLDKAIITWATNPNQEGANEATEFIKQINLFY